MRSSGAYDLAVVGGGIVGLATAMELLGRFPRARLVLLEKEPQLAGHQTGHNSGVIHSGVYYRPGSLKAQTCVSGANLLVQFCRASHLPYTVCGKLIVATDATEVVTLEELYRRGLANGVPGLRLIQAEDIRAIEPYARGVRALHVPSAGLVDYRAVAQAMADVIRGRGGTIGTSTRVQALRREGREWILSTTSGAFRSRYLITCGGLYADRLAVMGGAPSDLRIVPFRGDYYDVVPERRGLVHGMIYPVPNPTLPFLGVHLTRSIDGGVHAGPNAVLALKREGYRKADLHLGDAFDLVSSVGFWRMARAHWRTGLREWRRSLSKRAFVRSLQRLVPEVRAEDLIPDGSGVRAQAVDPRGALVDDFDIVQSPHATHVRNVPSPAATASLRIGQLIAEMVQARFALP